MMLIQLTGRVFGKLTVLERSTDKNGQPAWLCKCTCGNEGVVAGGRLRYGRQDHFKCCQPHRNFIHGHAGYGETQEYRAWNNAKSRCFNPANKSYKDYGGRGITMCEEWRNSFPAFISHLGPCPPNYMLDRINNEMGYQPGNCRWATRTTQNRNSRKNHLITLNDATYTIAEWALLTGIKAGTIWYRAAIAKWPPEKILTSSPVNR